MTFYKARTRYQYAPESDDIVIDIQALEGAVSALNNGTLELVEATRRLIEFKESGLLLAIDQIIDQTQPKQAVPRTPLVAWSAVIKAKGLR